MSTVKVSSIITELSQKKYLIDGFLFSCIRYSVFDF